MDACIFGFGAAFANRVCGRPRCGPAGPGGIERVQAA